jgi:hypothetical protein
MDLTEFPLAGHYCGQKQPHAAHMWQTPPIYGATTFVSTYQCAGLAPAVATEDCARCAALLGEVEDRGLSVVIRSVVAADE